MPDEDENLESADELPEVPAHAERHSLEGWRITLGVFAKYHKRSHHGIEAQHDIVYSPCASDAIDATSEDGILLRSLGWFPDTECDVWAHYT